MRSESSLSTTTEAVLSLFATEGELDLNALVARLGVPKRRLYDITNVLEGINVVRLFLSSRSGTEKGFSALFPEPPSPFSDNFPDEESFCFFILF